MDFDKPTQLTFPEGKLAYYRFGRGPDVVFIHGWPLSAATFRRIVPLLSPRYTLHLFDLPGTGHTEWNGRIDMESHAETVRRAIDRLGMLRYSLVAHDSGGAIARLVAAGDARVQALVLGNTEIPGHTPWQVRLYKWGADRPRVAALMFASMKLGFIRRSPLGFGGCFRDPRFADGEFGARFITPMLMSRRVAAGQMALVRSLDFRFLDRLPAVHARIAAPVRLIWGSDDPFFPLAKARAMVRQFAAAEIVEIPGAKLFAHEDHPEIFAARVDEFLGRQALHDDLIVQHA
jgi:pimeloyl-ACP methyl ester carboxylesterase